MKIAVCTLSSDLYIKGTQTLLYSFVKNNKWFTGDFVVLYEDTHCPLSQENRNILTNLYSNVKFVEINEKKYKKLFSIWNGHITRDKIIRAFKFDAFLMTEYDRIMLIDSDCLINGDVEELFQKNTNFCAANNDYEERDYYETRIKKSTIINTGVMVFDKRTIGKTFFDSVINTGISMRLYGDEYKAIDLEILNERFFSRAVTLIPSKFNTLKRTNDIEATIYHFNNKKPWESVVGFETMCNRWNTYYQESISAQKVVVDNKDYNFEYVDLNKKKLEEKENAKKTVTSTLKTKTTTSTKTTTTFNMEAFEEEYSKFINSLKEQNNTEE